MREIIESLQKRRNDEKLAESIKQKTYSIYVPSKGVVVDSLTREDAGIVFEKTSQLSREVNSEYSGKSVYLFNGKEMIHSYEPLEMVSLLKEHSHKIKTFGKFNFHEVVKEVYSRLNGKVLVSDFYVRIINECAKHKLPLLDLDTVLGILKESEIKVEGKKLAEAVVICERTDEKDVARQMKVKGYNYFVNLEGDERNHYFKTAEEIGEFIRTEYPDAKMTASGSIEEFLNESKKLPGDSFQSDGDTVFVLDSAIPAGNNPSDRLMVWINDLDKDGYGDWLYGELGSNEGITDINRKEIFWGSDVHDAMTLDESKKRKRLQEQSYQEWEGTAIAENEQVSRELNRATYKIDDVWVHQHEYLPSNFMKKSSFWTVVNLQFPETPENKAIVESFGGTLTADWYCSEGYKMPNFGDLDHNLEHAFNFVKGYKDTDLIKAENIDGDMFSDAKHDKDVKDSPVFFVDYSTIFDSPSNKYDRELFQTTLKNAGATDAWSEDYSKGQNQPDVVMFVGISAEEAEEALNQLPVFSRWPSIVRELSKFKESLKVIREANLSKDPQGEKVDPYSDKGWEVLGRSLKRQMLPIGTPKNLKGNFEESDTQYIFSMSEVEVSGSSQYVVPIEKQINYMRSTMSRLNGQAPEYKTEERTEGDTTIFTVTRPAIVTEAKTFDVFLNDEEIDTVFYSDGPDVNEEYVKNDLINHDGYDPNIEVKWVKENQKINGVFFLSEALRDIDHSINANDAVEWDVLMDDDVVGTIQFSSSISDEDLFGMLKLQEYFLTETVLGTDIKFDRSDINHIVVVDINEGEMSDIPIMALRSKRVDEVSPEFSYESTDRKRIRIIKELHSTHPGYDMEQELAAIQVLRISPNVASLKGGMTREDAKEVLRDLGYSDKQIARYESYKPSSLVLSEEVVLTKIGNFDRNNRPIYKDEQDKIYVDVDINDDNPNIHTVTDAGEPDIPIKNWTMKESVQVTGGMSSSWSVRIAQGGSTPEDTQELQNVHEYFKMKESSPTEGYLRVTMIHNGYFQLLGIPAFSADQAEEWVRDKLNKESFTDSIKVVKISKLRNLKENLYMTSDDPRKAVIDDYDVDESGVITTPGRFEGGMIYEPYFWDTITNASSDYDIEDTDGIVHSMVSIMQEEYGYFPELVEDGKPAECIHMYVDENGFVFSELISRDMWDEFESSIEDHFNDLDADPESDEDSIQTEDDEHWYQYGKLYFTGDRSELKAKMDADSFWPNVFSVSDHGNAHLISGSDNWWNESRKIKESRTWKPGMSWYENSYKCTGCGEEWMDEWSCEVDDECPNCGTVMTPYESKDITSLMDQRHQLSESQDITVSDVRFRNDRKGSISVEYLDAGREIAQSVGWIQIDDGSYQFSPSLPEEVQDVAGYQIDINRKKKTDSRKRRTCSLKEYSTWTVDEFESVTSISDVLALIQEGKYPPFDFWVLKGSEYNSDEVMEMVKAIPPEYVHDDRMYYSIMALFRNKGEISQFITEIDNGDPSAALHALLKASASSYLSESQTELLLFTLREIETKFGLSNGDWLAYLPGFIADIYLPGKEDWQYFVELFGNGTLDVQYLCKAYGKTVTPMYQFIGYTPEPVMDKLLSSGVTLTDDDKEDIRVLRVDRANETGLAKYVSEKQRRKGSKRRTNESKGFQCEFEIQFNQKDVIKVNAEEIGLTPTSQFWELIDEHMEKTERQTVYWLSKEYGGARLSGHTQSGDAQGLLYVTNKDKIPEIKEMLNVQDTNETLSTTTGSMPLEAQEAIYKGIMDEYAQLLDITIWFFGGVDDPDSLGEKNKKRKASKRTIKEKTNPALDKMMQTSVTIGGITLSMADHLWIYQKAGFTGSEIDKILGPYYSRVSAPDYEPSPGITNMSREDAYEMFYGDQGSIGYVESQKRITDGFARNQIRFMRRLKESKKTLNESFTVSIPKDIGRLAGQWYDGMSDPLYAISSSSHAGNPVSSDIIEDAIYNVELDLTSESDEERKLELRKLLNGLTDLNSKGALNHVTQESRDMNERNDWTKRAVLRSWTGDENYEDEIIYIDTDYDFGLSPHSEYNEEHIHITVGSNEEILDPQEVYVGGIPDEVWQTHIESRKIQENQTSDEAYELYLYLENDADLYRQQYTPILKNLINKAHRGVYDHDKSVKLWMYLVDAAAKKYQQEFGSLGDKWHETFSKADRLLIAKFLADAFVVSFNGNEFTEDMVAKKYQNGKAPKLDVTAFNIPLGESRRYLNEGQYDREDLGGIKVTNNDGKVFNVRVTKKESSDFSKSLGDLFVEFYDATYEDDDRFGEFGQHTGGTYYVSTILEKGREFPNGLCLHGGVPEWCVSADNMKDVVEFISGFEDEVLDLDVSLPELTIEESKQINERRDASGVDWEGMEYLDIKLPDNVLGDVRSEIVSDILEQNVGEKYIVRCNQAKSVSSDKPEWSDAQGFEFKNQDNIAIGTGEASFTGHIDELGDAYLDSVHVTHYNPLPTTVQERTVSGMKPRKGLVIVAPSKNITSLLFVDEEDFRSIENELKLLGDVSASKKGDGYWAQLMSYEPYETDHEAFEDIKDTIGGKLLAWEFRIDSSSNLSLAAHRKFIEGHFPNPDDPIGTTGSDNSNVPMSEEDFVTALKKSHPSVSEIEIQENWEAYKQSLDESVAHETPYQEILDGLYLGTLQGQFTLREGTLDLYFVKTDHKVARHLPLEGGTWLGSHSWLGSLSKVDIDVVKEIHAILDSVDMYPQYAGEWVDASEASTLLGTSNKEKILTKVDESDHKYGDVRDTLHGQKYILMSYETWDNESREIGETDEKGWADTSGGRYDDPEGAENIMDPDEIDLHGDDNPTAVDNAVKFLSDQYVGQTSSSPFSPGDWYTTTDPERDYQTGEETYFSFHLYGFTPEEETEIYTRLKDDRIVMNRKRTGKGLSESIKRFSRKKPQKSNKQFQSTVQKHRGLTERLSTEPLSQEPSPDPVVPAPKKRASSKYDTADFFYKLKYSDEGTVKDIQRAFQSVDPDSVRSINPPTKQVMIRIQSKTRREADMIVKDTINSINAPIQIERIQRHQARLTKKKRRS
jgi:predicted  nucleic acid-binding Zn-ribbon protein